MEHQLLETLNCMNIHGYNPNLVVNYAHQWNYVPPSTTNITSRDGIECGGSRDPSVVEEDTFGLEFAALQWLNLVTNAEELFNKLMNSILLTGEEKEQIRRWLCLKQECEECVASDEGTSLGENHRRSLERIEELTEDTERTGQSSESIEKSSDSQYESETESDFEYQHPDFDDKLFGYMERFRDKTDDLIRIKHCEKEDLNSKCNQETPSSVLNSSLNINAYKGRRKSIHPGSVPLGLPLLPMGENGVQAECSTQTEQPTASSLPTQPYTARSVETPLLSVRKPIKQLKLLTSEYGSKKNQIKQVTVDLEGVNKRIEELQHTIQIKEQFIKDMIKNSDTRASAKQRVQRKWSKLEEEYFKTRVQLTQAKSALEAAKKRGGPETVTKLKNDVEKCKNLAKHYEKRLTDIELIKKIAGDSAKKVLELENSLQNSRKQMEKLKKQLKKEEELKIKLEKELNEDQKKIKTIEDKYNVQASKSDKKKIAENEVELGLAKSKKGKEKEKKGSNLKLSQSFSQSDQESLRHEINCLRNSRLHLLDQRSKLEEKYKKNKTISSTEERLYLECEETIEAIDATIEFKNELICGRKVERIKEKGEKELMDTLLKLTPDEMRTLLYKYFKRVIDLKENGRKIEQQLDIAEAEGTSHLWKIRELSHTLQAERLEAEQQMVALQRDHQEKLHLMLRHFAEESSSSGTEAAGRQIVIARDSELVRLKRENKNLKRRLQEMEALMQAAAASRTVMCRPSRSASPDPQLKAPPSTSSSASKVTRLTREKNKVIIQFDSSKKKPVRNNLLALTCRK